ncbi:MAG: DUF2314 domain-containing protein [Candidatus Accumulibacter sp.]|nr:DUF2314 domain-containing protein [Accumulibacter sp.]
MAQDTVFLADETPQMLEAFKKAQNTFKYFWRESYWECHRTVPVLDMANVKVVFIQENPAAAPLVEYMWIGDVDFDGIRVKGFLINNPDVLSNIKKGDAVEIPLDKVADWIFAIDGKAHGGFTVQVMRAGMSKKERREHDRAWGLDFGDPNKTLVAYEQEKHPENLIEHPMCINTKNSAEDFMKKNPGESTSKDELGYTRLHRETIAGNKALVELLLQMGADMNAKTNEGYSALDFARKLGWEHIIPILQG